MCHAAKISRFPRFLSLLRRKKRNPANLFTFPRCQDKLGGLHVGAQSRRQLFYKKSVWGWTLPFASSSFARRDGGPHLPGRVGLASLGRGGRAASSRMDARPHGPTLRTHGGRRGGGSGGEPGLRTQAPAAAWLRVRWRVRALGWEPDRARGRRSEARFSSKNAHQKFCFIPPPFLKAKAIIYRSFRFAECSLFELDIQTPPKGEGGLGARKEAATAGEAVRRGGALDAPALPGS